MFAPGMTGGPDGPGRGVRKAGRIMDESRSQPAAVAADDEEYVLERQVGHLLRRAHQRHTALFQEMIAEHSLTPLQFAALVKLHDLGEASQNHLGRLTAMDAATMQGVIKRLLARGLIDRRPDPDDRRRLILSLSEAGRVLVIAAIDRGREITRRTLDPLDADEQEVFLDCLARLAE